MGYNTNYQIFDLESKTSIFKNDRNACFAEWANQDINSSKWDNNYIEVYSPHDKLMCSEEVLNWWLDKLNTIFEFKIKYDVFDIDNNINSYPKHLKKGKHCKWTLNYHDYSCKAHLKYALNMIRYIFEENMFNILNDCYELEKEYPDEDLFILFQYCGAYPKKSGIVGHLLYYAGRPVILMNLDTLKSYFQSLKDKPYTNNEIFDINSKQRISSYCNTALYNYFTRNILNFKEYKEKLTEYAKQQTPLENRI